MSVLVNSSPSTFVMGPIGSTLPNPTKLTPVTFAIPAGTYSQAYWQIDGTLEPIFGSTYPGSFYLFFDTSNTAEDVWGFFNTTGFPASPLLANVIAGGIGGIGILLDPGLPILPIPTGGQSISLSAINAAAGGNLTAYVGYPAPSGGLTVTRLTLVLTPVSTGGSATQYTFLATAGPCNNGSDVLMIQMLDADGNAANAPGGGQVFAFSSTSNGARFNPSTLTIPSGSSAGTDTFSNQQSGIFSVTVTPGAGPLSGVAAQTIPVSVCGAPSDPNAAMCTITRPNIRDAVRMHLGIATPLSTGTGNAGDEPPGQRYPTNFELNQAIADALRFINTECNLHMTTDIPIMVPAAQASAVGPLIIPLAGVQGCPSSLSINTIRRCRFVDTTGVITRLTPTSYWEIDKNRWSYDTVPAANPPRWYMIDGYKLFILPAPSVEGTVLMYAGTAMQNFNGDSDTIDELSSDHQLTMEWLATAFVCMKKPDEPNNMAQFTMYMNMAKPGVKNIKRFFQMMNEAYQPSVSADVGRRRRVR